MHERGFIGLIGLLIGVSLIAFLALGQYMGSHKDAAESVVKEGADGGIRAIEGANEVKNLIEEKHNIDIHQFDI